MCRTELNLATVKLGYNELSVITQHIVFTDRIEMFRLKIDRL
jgi:hypothetical protein